MLYVTDVTPLDGHRLRVEFNDGVVREVDCSFLLHGTLGEPLRDLEYFRQARVDGEARTVVWPNGLDPAPELLHGDYEPPKIGRSHAEPTRAALPARTAAMKGRTPDIAAVSVVRHGVLRLQFADGVTGDVAVLDRMRGPVFDQARTPAGFAEAEVDAETGTVVWPGGADLAPDTLYERVRTGAWPDRSVAAA